MLARAPFVRATAPMRTDPTDAEHVMASLELAAAQGGDLTDRVYAILFERQPEMQALFRRDTDGAIKGEMLARVFEAILDFIGERRYAHRMIQCEVITHENYDVPPAVFTTFFGIVADAVREACGAGWTGEMDGAWTRLLADLEFFVANTNQYAT